MSNAAVIGRRTWMRLAVALTVMVGAGLAVPVGVGTAAAAPVIVGTWELNAPGAPTVRLIQTYAAEGTMMSVGDDHPSRTPQLGAWTEVGERQFLMRNISFWFDSSGAISRRIEARVLFTVDPAGNTMTGRGERYEQDATGAALGPAVTFQVRGTRITPVPLAGTR